MTFGARVDLPPEAAALYRSGATIAAGFSQVVRANHPGRHHGKASTGKQHEPVVACSIATCPSTPEGMEAVAS